MSKVFFIADTHFGDDAIRRYENRPFDNSDIMDEEMIRLWNETVDASDTVYILGDFGAVGNEKDILSRLNGTKFLVKGNHDTKSNEYYRSAGFSEIYDLPILFNNFWILSHEPIYINENMPYANLFGHVHNSPIVKDFSRQHYCVSVERINYKPIDFDEIKMSVSDFKE